MKPYTGIYTRSQMGRVRFRMKLWYWKIMVIGVIFVTDAAVAKQAKRALQKWREKPQIEKFMELFLSDTKYNGLPELVDLLITVFDEYLSKCIPIVLYDKENLEEYQRILQILLKEINGTFLFGTISEYKAHMATKFFENKLETHCVSYILFINDVYDSRNEIGRQNMNKVVVVTKSSQWRVNEFLSGDTSRTLINLLIIGPSIATIFETEICYILYTHNLYVDGLGASSPKLLTSWRNGSLTRDGVTLFPPKMKNGFCGHRFITSVAHMPPFIIKSGLNENDEVIWDGIEIRLLKMLSQLYNFTIDTQAAKYDTSRSPADKVIDEVRDGTAKVGASGIYLTIERLEEVDMTYPHSYDCAAFLSLTSTALPRYRAILGPFHWTVWLTIMMIYLLAIFPLTFADKHTLRHMCKNPKYIENMLWHVFGTFTNCFTYGKETWTKSSKFTPKLLMGFYWIFTTIITACYTGSIIAFITIPLKPVTVDTVDQLLSGRFRVGTLNKGGWEFWFQHSTHLATQQLLKRLELLADAESGLRNITKAIFFPYAFLESRAHLEYIVLTNFTTTYKRSVMHISSECFVPFGVSTAFAKNSIYRDIIDKGISHLSQSGLIDKINRDIRWDFMRSVKGKLLQANAGIGVKITSIEDRSLALADTQGIFLFLVAGFLFGLFSLIFETVGGCLRCCKRGRKKFISSLETTPKIRYTPFRRGTLNSIQLNDDIILHVGLENSLEVKMGANVYVYSPSKRINLRSRNVETKYCKDRNFEHVFGERTMNSKDIVS